MSSTKSSPFHIQPTSTPSASLELAHGWHSTAIHLLRQLRAEDRHSGLSPARLSALSVVVFSGPIRLGDLAKAEQVSAPTMTKIIQFLEQSGLVERQKQAQDARVNLIAATQAGKVAMAEGRDRRVRLLHGALERLDSEDQDQLAKALTLLQRVLEDLQEQRENP